MDLLDYAAAKLHEEMGVFKLLVTEIPSLTYFNFQMFSLISGYGFSYGFI